MDLWSLQPGTKVEVEDGAIAEVLALTEDGHWIRIRYLKAPRHPDLVDTEDLCAADEVLAVRTV